MLFRSIQAAYDALVAAGDDPDGAKAKDLMRLLVEKAITLPVAKADEIFIYDNTQLQDIDFIGDSPKLSYVYDWEPANAG